MTLGSGIAIAGICLAVVGVMCISPLAGLGVAFLAFLALLAVLSQ